MILLKMKRSKGLHIVLTQEQSSKIGKSGIRGYKAGVLLKNNILKEQADDSLREHI